MRQLETLPTMLSVVQSFLYAVRCNPLQEEMVMEVDDDGTQQVRKVAHCGIKVDFKSLYDDKLEVSITGP